MLAENVGTVNVIQAKFTLIPPSPPNSGSIVELEALDRHQPSKINGNVCQELSNTALRGIRWNQGDNNDGKSKTHQFERIPGTVPRTSVLHCGMAKLQFISCAKFNILKKYIIYLPTDSQTNNVTFVSNLIYLFSFGQGKFLPFPLQTKNFSFSASRLVWISSNTRCQ